MAFLIEVTLLVLKKRYWEATTVPMKRYPERHGGRSLQKTRSGTLPLLQSVPLLNAAIRFVAGVPINQIPACQEIPEEDDEHGDSFGDKHTQASAFV